MKLCGVLTVVLCVSSASFGAVSLGGNTLTYGSPSDLGTTIDPVGLNDVQQSFGVSKAAFQAFNPQVVEFNNAPAANQILRTLVVDNTASGTVTFTFPAAMYNYGSRTSVGRGAFSGSNYGDAISTVPTVSGGMNNWFEADIATTGGQGVSALGFCAGFRNDQQVFAGQALFTLSDGSTVAIDLPALGIDSSHPNDPEYIFLGYQAPAGLTITRVEASRTSLPGGAYASIDDLSFVMTPEPATLSLLALSGLLIARRRHA